MSSPARHRRVPATGRTAPRSRASVPRALRGPHALSKFRELSPGPPSPALGESCAPLQASQGDPDQPANGIPRAQAAGRIKSMEAVSGELVRCDIVPNLAGLHAFAHQFTDQLTQVSMRAGNM